MPVDTVYLSVPRTPGSEGSWVRATRNVFSFLPGPQADLVGSPVPLNCIRLGWVVRMLGSKWARLLWLSDMPCVGPKLIFSLKPGQPRTGLCEGGPRGAAVEFGGPLKTGLCPCPETKIPDLMGMGVGVSLLSLLPRTALCC